MISSSSTISSEIRYISADKPNDKWELFQARQRDLEYEVEDGGQILHLN